MAARDLKKIRKRIAQTRADIALQHEIVRELKRAGDAAVAARAEELVKTLEQSLTVFLERRQTILRNLRRTALVEGRRPRASRQAS
jgi:hypothetical protein